MSTNRRNAPRTNLPGRSPDTSPAVSLTPESPKMAQSGREIENSQLTFRQRSAHPTSAVSPA